MNRIFITICLALTGCATAPVARPPVASAPVVASQEGKDTTVLAEAAKIDAIARDAKPHTDAQRAAVAAAPAGDVAKLAKAFESQISDILKANTEKDKQIEGIVRERDEARNATDRTILIGGYALAALLVASGVATFFLMAQLVFLGPRIGFALIGAGVSIFLMLQFYQWTKSHSWITGVAGFFLVAAGVLAFANHAHAKSENEQ